MKAHTSLPVLLLLGAVCTSAAAQIYKCRQADGSMLYSDSPCDPDAEELATMPKGSTQFQPTWRWDPLVEDDLAVLNAQEQKLLQELREAQVEPGQSLQETGEVYTTRRQIIAMLKSVRRQKTAVLGRGLSTEEGEELISIPDNGR